MRTAIVTLSLGMAVALLGCGLFDGGHGAAESEGVTPVAPGVTPVAPEVAPSLAPATPPGMAASLSVSYDGHTSLEERILKSPVIARVRLDSATSTVESGTTYRGMKYSVLLEFSFSVLEYLKGSGANDIVAVWAAEPFFDTRQEAEAALPAIAAARDTRWDNHEAIVFLQNSEASLASTQQADRYYLAWGGSWNNYGVGDDGYSIASRHDKLWLPAAAAVDAPSQPSGDQQRFLTDVGTTPMITLGEIKTRIAAVIAKLDAGDGSDEYLECVRRTYHYERRDSHDINAGGDGLVRKTPDHELDSGLAAPSMVYEESPVFGGLPDKKGRTWLDGWGRGPIQRRVRRCGSLRLLGRWHERLHLFCPSRGVGTPASRRGLQVPLQRRLGCLRSVRGVHGPLRVDGHRHCPRRPRCTRAFFDPVTVGAAVLADSTNGVLKPAEFTDANGASATIEQVAWEAGTGDSGTVKLKLSPHDGIAGHTLHFIALDGSLSLSLKVAEATVDGANDTLSWRVASQPWDDGDKLMLRIR